MVVSCQVPTVDCRAWMSVVVVLVPGCQLLGISCGSSVQAIATFSIVDAQL
jgi:hypothetical protein